MRTFGQKLLSIALAASMSMGFAVTAGAAAAKAAPSPWVVNAADRDISLTKDGKALASYEAKTSDLILTSNKDGKLLLCFTDSTGKARAISLGAQKTVTVEGLMGSLTLNNALDDKVKVTLGATANAGKLTVASANDVTIDGKVGNLLITRAAKVHVSKDAKVTKTTKTDKYADLTVDRAAPAKQTTTSGLKKSSGYRLHIKPIEGEEGDLLKDLTDELNEKVYAYDVQTDEPIDGTAAFSGSRYAELEDKDKSYPFVFTPDDLSIEPLKGNIKIYVKGAHGDVTLEYKQNYIDAKAGDTLNSLKDELKDIVKAYDDNGDVVKGTFKWSSSGSTKLDSSDSGRSYNFDFKPSSSSRYDEESGSITINVT